MRRRILITVALLLLLPIVAVSVLIYTPVGVAIASSQLHRLERFGIRIEGVSGTFSGPLAVQSFELNHPRVHVVAHEIRIDPQMRGLLLQTIRTGSLTARDVLVELKEAQMPPPERPPRFVPPFMRIDARGARLTNVRYVHVDGRTIDADEIRGRVTISSHRLRVRRFRIEGERLAASGSLRLTASRPLGIALETRGSVKLQPNLTVALQAKLGGDVDRMTLEGTILEPSEIAAKGLFVREEETWRLTGGVSSPSFTLDPWLDEPPFSFSDIALEVEVEPNQIHAAGVFSVPEYDLHQVGVDARGRYAERVLHVHSSELTLAGTPTRIHARGSLTFAGGPPDLNLDARWTDLQWPLRDRAVVHSRQGEALVRGTLPYDFDVRTEIEGEKVPATHGTAQGVLSKEALSISQYDIELLGGKAQGSAKLQFAEPRAWTLAADATDLDVGTLFPDVPGRVGFTASASGTGLNKEATFALSLANVHGTLKGEALRGAGEIERTAQGWAIREARASLGQGRLALDATIADTIDARWDVSTPSLGLFVPNAGGAIAFSGTARGGKATPFISATLSGRDLELGAWAAGELSIDGDIDASSAQPSRLSVAARRIGHGTRLLDSLHLSGTGTALDHRVAIDAIGTAENSVAAPRARMQLTGKYEEEAWTGTIVSTRLTRGSPAQELDTAEPAAVHIARDRASLDDLCFVIEAGRLCAGGQWERGGEWEARISGYEIPLATVLPSPEAGVEYGGRIEGSARAFGSPTQPWQGEAGMKISDAAIIYRREGAEPEALNLGTGGLHLLALPDRITLSFGVQAFTDTFLHTNLQLVRNGSNDIMHLPLSGDVRARAADANLLPLAFPEVDRAAGLLTATGRVGGTLARPELNGRIELADAELDSYRTNLALRDLDLVAMIDGSRLDFRGTGNAGEGQLTIDGDLTWRNGASKGAMRLRGNDLLVADLPEYRVVASPDLEFEIDGNKILVRGDVTIPSARVQPARLRGAVGPSADARYVGEHAAERDGRFTVRSDVRVQMGDDVRVDAFGLHARIEGGVTTSVRTGATTTGRGELRIAEGRYEAYGQQLEISRGQLLFDNAPLEDPGLDIEARRRIETVTVGLNVRGTLQEPRLTFFSDPSMPQTQIVSYLLVGRPANAPAAGDAETLSSPSDTLALQGGGFLASQIGRRLGIEEVGVENYINAAGEANPSLVLGKFLSPRLFISYGISLTESINTLKLRYTISDRWVLRTESGEAQSADLEYTIER